MDKVSIITPMYNASRFVKYTIESVLSQTYSNWELIIVDDCSSDNSFDIVKDYCQRDHRIKLLKMEKNSGGPIIPRNTGIDMAEGRYIAFLDSDDIWVPNKLEKQINFMQEKQCVLSYSAYKKIDEYGAIIGNNPISVPSIVTYKDLLKSNFIPCLTAIYDSQKIGKIFQHKDSLVASEDHLLWLSILRNNDECALGINEPLAYYRIHGKSISNNKVVMAKNKWRIYREWEKLSVLGSIWYFIHYVYYGLRKKYN